MPRDQPTRRAARTTSTVQTGSAPRSLHAPSWPPPARSPMPTLLQHPGLFLWGHAGGRSKRGASPLVLRLRCDCAGSALTGERPVAWLHRGRPLRLLVQCTGLSPLSVTAVASGGQRVEVGGGIQGARCSPHAGGRLGCHCCHRGLPPVPLQCFPALVASVA